MTDTEIISRYKADRRRKALLKHIKSQMNSATMDLYLTVLDDVTNAISRLEGDLYLSENDPEFKNLLYIYDRLLSVKFSIESRLP